MLPYTLLPFYFFLLEMSDTANEETTKRAPAAVAAEDAGEPPKKKVRLLAVQPGSDEYDTSTFLLENEDGDNKGEFLVIMSCAHTLDDKDDGNAKRLRGILSDLKCDVNTCLSCKCHLLPDEVTASCVVCERDFCDGCAWRVSKGRRVYCDKCYDLEPFNSV